jgi:hypothetical protein
MLLTRAVNCNSLNRCRALGMPSASRRAAMVPLAALQASPLELDMRWGIHGGNSTRVTGLAQRALPRASAKSWPFFLFSVGYRAFLAAPALTAFGPPSSVVPGGRGPT